MNEERLTIFLIKSKAVRWAIIKRVHIISMSWTIEAEYDILGLKELEKATNEAYQVGIIMLCATSDQGNISSENCYPGAWKQAMRIGAATETGEKCTRVHGQMVDFLFPGENISVETKLRSHSSKAVWELPCHGTSIRSGSTSPVHHSTSPAATVRRAKRSGEDEERVCQIT